ncbi:uncharacterized protein LOC112191497 [Rosa chinensis]|uniref:uncharacterized protein LOC112191497 n=1 Tax=Rosa chinensis TaxID=74649 RepID=UPI001AD8F6AD|nr:uncharacterized protein LOC112191497 [Rosa chinensis]
MTTNTTEKESTATIPDDNNDEVIIWVWADLEIMKVELMGTFNLVFLSNGRLGNELCLHRWLETAIYLLHLLPPTGHLSDKVGDPGSLTVMQDSVLTTCAEAQYIRRHHRHEPRENQCTSALVRHVKAPVHLIRFLSSLATNAHMKFSNPNPKFSSVTRRSGEEEDGLKISIL